MPAPPDTPLSVPAYRGQLAPLPSDRRKAFLSHLKSIIKEALLPPEKRRPARLTPPISPALLEVAAKACAVCSGHCCSKGGTHAYLDEDSIRAIMRNDPALTPRALINRYIAHLPANSFALSCVFHAAAGCTLPRNLRGQLCNSFYCTPLSRFFRDHPSADTNSVQIVNDTGGATSFR